MFSIIVFFVLGTFYSNCWLF